jgi:hypothetical protein
MNRLRQVSPSGREDYRVRAHLQGLADSCRACSFPGRLADRGDSMAACLHQAHPSDPAGCLVPARVQTLEECGSFSVPCQAVPSIAEGASVFSDASDWRQALPASLGDSIAVVEAEHCLAERRWCHLPRPCPRRPSGVFQLAPSQDRFDAMPYPCALLYIDVYDDARRCVHLMPSIPHVPAQVQ